MLCKTQIAGIFGRGLACYVLHVGLIKRCKVTLCLELIAKNMTAMLTPSHYVARRR